VAGGEEAEAQAGRADQHRHHDAETVRQPAHQDAAHAEADHQRGVGQRGVRAVDAELGLDRRQRDRRRVHADAAERRDRERHGKAQPGVGRFGL
jgi:hypothetical protein